MTKYLIQSSYTLEGLKGLLKEGGTSRREAGERAIESMGGTQEAYYFSFGDWDQYIIVDLPDNVSASAISLIANASGAAAKVKFTVLLTPEETDQATDLAREKMAAYRPPGQ